MDAAAMITAATIGRADVTGGMIAGPAAEVVVDSVRRAGTREMTDGGGHGRQGDPMPDACRVQVAHPIRGDRLLRRDATRQRAARMVSAAHRGRIVMRARHACRWTFALYRIRRVCRP